MELHTQLNETEARVIGCLIEKSVITPDQYPMTLNALTSACNQKSSRHPVMSLSQGEVQHAIRDLEGKHHVRTDENFKSRAEKYAHRFCNTRYSDLQFSDAELAIVCLVLLRGAQTPGELRARAERLHHFEDNAAVVQALNALTERDSGPLVVKLPRTPGRKDSEYMHLFSGAVDIEAHVSQAREQQSAAPKERHSVAELTARVSELEAQVAAINEKLRADE